MKLRPVAINHTQLVCIYQYKKGRQKIMEKACHFRFGFQRLNAAMLFSCYEFRFMNSTYCYFITSLTL